METIIGGIKNISRSKIRNIAIILILTLSLSLGLMMISMDISSNNKVKEIKKELGNKFDVSISREYVDKLFSENRELDLEKENPFMFEESYADKISNIYTVKSVIKNITGTFSSNKLKSRTREMLKEITDEQGELSVKIEVGGGSEFSEGFNLHGIDEASMINGFQDESMSLVEGSLFEKGDIENDVCLIEKEFAKRNNLKVGSDIVINGEKIKVCGIYECKTSEGMFEPKSVSGSVSVSISSSDIESEKIYTPFKTAQRLLNLKDKVVSMTVYVDSIDNVDKTVNYINKVISDGKMTALQETGKYEPVLLNINTIKRISKVGMISAFAVGAIVILSIMFINVRGRVKEIGILKAIGASNLNISTQFLAESMTLCIIALILSMIIILGTNQMIADVVTQKLLPDSESLSKMPSDFKKEILEIAKLGKLEIIFTSEILLYAVLITFLLGAIGTIIPAFYISKLRPAEVLRFE